MLFRRLRCEKMVILFEIQGRYIQVPTVSHLMFQQHQMSSRKLFVRKVRCTNIVTASQFRFKGEDNNVSQIFVNLFDLDFVKKLDSNCTLSFLYVRRSLFTDC